MKIGLRPYVVKPNVTVMFSGVGLGFSAGDQEAGALNTLPNRSPKTEAKMGEDRMTGWTIKEEGNDIQPHVMDRGHRNQGHWA